MEPTLDAAAAAAAALMAGYVSTLQRYIEEDAEVRIVLDGSNAMLIVALLRHVTTRANMSQRQLAEQLGASQSWLSRVLRGANGALISVSQCRAWLDACDADDREREMLDRFLALPGNARVMRAEPAMMAAEPGGGTYVTTGKQVRDPLAGLSPLRRAFASTFIEVLASEGPAAAAEMARQMVEDFQGE